MKIKFSKIALEELHVKLEIVVSEPDLHESYDMTEEEATVLFDKFNFNQPGFYEISDKEAAVISGELENSCDNSYGNLVRVYKHVISQIKNGGAFEHQLSLKKAREARPKVVQLFAKPLRKRGQRGRIYPVNGVIEEKCGIIELAAKMLIERYENNTRAHKRDVVKIRDRKIVYFAVNQSRGRAYYNRKGVRIVTIPKFVIDSDKPGYLTYYVAHELAHHYDDVTGGGVGHGETFMYWLKQLCPKEFQHYELGYKPKFARAAGIRQQEAA